MLRSLRQSLQVVNNQAIIVRFNGTRNWCSWSSSWHGSSCAANAPSSQGLLCRNPSPATYQVPKTYMLRQLGNVRGTQGPSMYAGFWSRIRGPQSRAWNISSTRRYYSSLPPDTVVYSIMLLNFGVFMAWQGPALRRFMSTHFTTSHSHMKAGYLHTLLTHAVSHAEPMHLFSNMFTFYFFGSSLGGIIGSGRVCSSWSCVLTQRSCQGNLDRSTPTATERRCVCSCYNYTQPQRSQEGWCKVILTRSPPVWGRQQQSMQL